MSFAWLAGSTYSEPTVPTGLDEVGGDKKHQDDEDPVGHVIAWARDPFCLGRE